MPRGIASDPPLIVSFGLLPARAASTATNTTPSSGAPEAFAAFIAVANDSRPAWYEPAPARAAASNRRKSKSCSGDPGFVKSGISDAVP